MLQGKLRFFAVSPTLSDIRELFRSEASTLKMQTRKQMEGLLREEFHSQFEDVKEPFRSEVSLLRDKQIGAIKDSVLQFSVNLGDRLTVTEEGCAVLRGRVEALEERLEAGAAALVQCDEQNIMRSLVREMGDGNYHKNNILIYGIQESSETESSERRITDSELAKKIIHTILPSLITGKFEFSRIGKYSPSLQRPRPIKVTLTIAPMVSELIQAYVRTSRSSPLPEILNGVMLITDKTPMQRKHYRRFKIELTQRTINEEKNLRIVTRDGTQLIVSGKGRNASLQKREQRAQPGTSEDAQARN